MLQIRERIKKFRILFCMLKRVYPIQFALFELICIDRFNNISDRLQFAFQCCNNNFVLSDTVPPPLTLIYVINVWRVQDEECRISVLHLRQCQHKVGVALTAVAPQLIEDGQGAGVRDAGGRHPTADAQHPICNNQTFNHNHTLHTKVQLQWGYIKTYTPPPHSNSTPLPKMLDEL